VLLGAGAALALDVDGGIEGSFEGACGKVNCVYSRLNIHR